MGPVSFYKLPLTEIGHLREALDTAENAGLPLILTNRGQPIAKAERDTKKRKRCLSWEDYYRKSHDWRRYGKGVSLSYWSGYLLEDGSDLPIGRLTVTLQELRYNAGTIVNHVAWRRGLDLRGDLVCFVTDRREPLAKITPHLHL